MTMSSEAGRYRRKSTEVEALQWTGKNWPDVRAFLHGQASISGNTVLTQYHGAVPGDWVVRDADDKVITVTAAVFAERYEPVPHQPEEHQDQPEVAIERPDTDVESRDDGAEDPQVERQAGHVRGGDSRTGDRSDSGNGLADVGCSDEAVRDDALRADCAPADDAVVEPGGVAIEGDPGWLSSQPEEQPQGEELSDEDRKELRRIADAIDAEERFEDAFQQVAFLRRLASTQHPELPAPLQGATMATAEAKVFTLPEIAKLAGAEYRTLHKWLERGLIQASVKPSRGNGNSGLFSERDAEIACLLTLLRSRGLDMAALAIVAADLNANRPASCPICNQPLQEGGG